MESVGFSKTLLPICQITWPHIVIMTSQNTILLIQRKTLCCFFVDYAPVCFDTKEFVKIQNIIILVFTATDTETCFDSDM
jgi:hypothetical protein